MGEVTAEHVDHITHVHRLGSQLGLPAVPMIAPVPLFQLVQAALAALPVFDAEQGLVVMCMLQLSDPTTCTHVRPSYAVCRKPSEP